MSLEQINTTNFDTGELKQDLIDYLKSTGKFDDFDFEGSTLNTIIDLLVRNDLYNAFLANMLANESFIASAQLRGNVVAHAQKLSYTPKSKTVSRAIVDLKVIPSDKTNLDMTIDVPINTIFISTVGEQSFQFTTIDTFLMSLDENNDYVVNDVTLYQGQYLTNSFVHIAGEPIVIPNKNIDTTTLKVIVNEGGDLFEYELASSISDLGKDSQVYFLSENYEGLYQIEFGRDLISKEPSTNAVVTLSYINGEAEHGNGAKTFIAGTTIGGYGNIKITATQPAYGGSDREDTESVRFLSTKNYQAQDRALTASDYSVLIKKEFPFVESIKVWGGEDNEPPQYGKVFVSIISEDNLTRSVKNNIVSYLKTYNVGSITPEIIDSDPIRLDLTVLFAVDTKRATKTFNQLSQDISDVVSDFSSTHLESFNGYYNDSKLNDKIMAIRGIESCDITKRAVKTLRRLTFNNPAYDYRFDNELVPGTMLVENIEFDSSATNQYLADDGNGNIVAYKTTDSEQSEIIGTIDYATGALSFTLNIISDEPTFDLSVEPKHENFYIYNSKYLFIGNTKFETMELFPNKR